MGSLPGVALGAIVLIGLPEMLREFGVKVPAAPAPPPAAGERVSLGCNGIRR